MTRANKWLLSLGALLVLLGAAWLALLRWLPSDEELARRASVELEAQLGVKVRVGALHWRLLPSPAVVMEDAATDQPQPIVIKKLTAYPDVFALWQHRIKVDRADVEGAVVPQLSLHGLGREREKTEAQADEVPLARLVFRDVTWISRRGIPVVYEGEVDFDPGWRPRKAELRRPGLARDRPAADAPRPGRPLGRAHPCRRGHGRRRTQAGLPRQRPHAPGGHAAAAWGGGRKHAGRLQPPVRRRRKGIGRDHAFGQRRHHG